MPPLGRTFVILFACFVAGFAGSVVVTVAALYPAVSNLVVDPFAETAFGYMVAFGALFLSLFAVLPWLLVIILGECLSIRSLLFYAGTGGALSFLLYMNASSWSMLAIAVDGFARRELEIMVAGGIVAGCVYWAIAGRKAGAWRFNSPGQTEA
jgi:hypothetical protein